MKKLWSTLLALLILLSSLMLGGCLPPNFSKEQAKKIAQEHHKDAVVWFQQHLPEAQVDKKSEAYTSGNDLLGAVTGEYKYKGKSFKYVYSYGDKKMYISDGYNEACQLIKNKVLQELGYKPEETEISFQGYVFTALNENDTPRQEESEAKASKWLRSSSEQLMPAWLTPEQFAETLLVPDTKESLPFYVTVYKDQFPERPSALDKYKNLSTVWCHRPVDLDKEPMGACSKLYNHGEGRDWLYHVTKVSDDLYAGYIARKDGKVQDKLRFTRKSDKEFTLEIPQHCHPIFFSKKNLTLVHSFKGASGQSINNVAEAMYKASYPGRKDVKNYGTYFSVVGDYNAYEGMNINLVKGVYNYKVLGILDLEYWIAKWTR